MKKTLLFLALSSTLFASDSAILLKKNCATCHILGVPAPEQIPTLTAPAMEAVGFHIKLAFEDKKMMKDFIVDYTLNPLASKSVCESNQVQKFGVMPSLKGKISKEDLEAISAYIIENYPTPKFTSMIKEMQTNGKMKALLYSPFLINQNRLPHVTKMLLENWDKAALGLSNEQKSKLLIIRKTTMSAVKKIKKEVKTLEDEIIEVVIDAEDIKSIDTKIDQLSKLKAQATRVHIKCITETIGILSDEQLEHLLPFWDS